MSLFVTLLPRLMNATLLGICILLAAAPGARAADAAAAPPNVVVIYCDDMGYGDLGCYGHPTIRTPHLDQMAAEGLRFTQFYSAAALCTPSRAALMTGRLPVRSGVYGNVRHVLFPNSPKGIPDSEITLAEALKQQGYRTACVGKWHLGHLPESLPLRHGFDTYYGLPYSNDMDRQPRKGGESPTAVGPPGHYWNVPLYRDDQIIERPADQRLLTKRYTEESVKFITENREQPFFLYLAHSMPHIPLFRSESFTDVSPRGLYGDVIEEIDWSVGQILDALRKQGLDKNTIVWFSSDNGPWLPFEQDGGSAGLLRDGKGTTWEGGIRVPGIVWWPGRIEANRVSLELASTMDIYATSIAMAGGQVPQDRVIDGRDLTGHLLKGDKVDRDHLAFYHGSELMALRQGPWKVHYKRRGAKPDEPPQLYQVDHDPSEKYNVAQRHPEVLARLMALGEKLRQETKIEEPLLDAPPLEAGQLTPTR